MATPEDVEVSLRRWAEMGKAERWMHTIDFIGPEDALELVCGDLEERGYTFVVGASEKDNGQEWPEVRAESHREKLEVACKRLLAAYEAEEEEHGFG